MEKFMSIRNGYLKHYIDILQNREDKISLLYMWMKQNKLNLKEFKFLIEWFFVLDEGRNV